MARNADVIFYTSPSDRAPGSRRPKKPNMTGDVLSIGLAADTLSNLCGLPYITFV